MSCNNLNSQVATVPADHRECWTCKQVLHKSSYYKENIIKYWNCILCERARLSKLRDKSRYIQTEDGRCTYVCPRCRTPIDMSLVIKGDKRFDYYPCQSCQVECRLAHRKDADPRTGAQYHPAKAHCPYCGKWGCTAFRAAICYKGDFHPNDVGKIYSMKQKAKRDARSEETKQKEKERSAARRMAMTEEAKAKARERDRERRAAKKAAAAAKVDLDASSDASEDISE